MLHMAAMHVVTDKAATQRPLPLDLDNPTHLAGEMGVGVDCYSQRDKDMKQGHASYRLPTVFVITRFVNYY